MNPETILGLKIQKRASELGARLFRNNVGTYKRGEFWIKYGVCNPGGSDYIGWTADGRFLATEVKVNTPTSEDQRAFLLAVIRAGGVGIIAHSVEEFTRALESSARK